ncbi:ferritin-like domain-containing protein [Embleya sp. NBC_00888]|uniref:ferritin-like domain-containing protein n=1 Tax=Embleya sp. NBC_00888 TaxID=2975960 RepID=UPI00386E7084|nr:ferritin-like domain-containing protein [Embleya sp. NBC_00888]
MSTPRPAPSGSANPEVRALSEALQAEHAAVYGYGVAGGRLTGAARTQARTALDTHRARRDTIARLITDRGAAAPAAAPAYTIPFPVGTPADATRLAVHLEDGVAVRLGELVALAGAPLRNEAAGWLRETAVWAVRWRGASTPFPGLPASTEPGTPTAGGRT